MKPILICAEYSEVNSAFETIGVPFNFELKRFESKMLDHLPPENLIKAVTFEFAREAAGSTESTHIIGISSLAFANGQKVKKSDHNRDFENFIAGIRGQPHQYYAGYTIIDRVSGKIDTKVDVTNVHYEQASLEIMHGALGITEAKGELKVSGHDDPKATITEKIQGDYFNIIGVPINLIARSLEEFGVYPASKVGVLNTLSSTDTPNQTPNNYNNSYVARPHSTAAAETLTQIRKRTFPDLDKPSIFKNQNADGSLLQNRFDYEHSHKVSDQNIHSEGNDRQFSNTPALQHSETGKFKTESSRFEKSLRSLYRENSSIEKQIEREAKLSSRDINSFSKNEGSDASTKNKLQTKKSKSKKQKREKKQKSSERKLMNIFFLFEIVRWIFGQDILARLVLAIIVGIFAFGLIFGFIDIPLFLKKLFS